ncbi:unnamed protein product [Diamesa serratosioi]
MKLRDEATLLTSGIDCRKPTVFEIHGYIEDHKEVHHVMLTEALVENYDQNVINVDWSIGSKSLDYYTARIQTENVGRVVAQQIDFLNERIGLNLTSVTVIGFSLGAHIAGYAGKNVRRGRIGTIVGLDASIYMYNYYDPTSRLDVSDADHVTAWHTSLFGFQQSIASADYFFNTGDKQPGCLTDLFSDSCSHHRSLLFLIEELRKPRSFWAKRCINDAQAVVSQCSNDPGSFLDQKIKGTFSVITNAQSPFGKGYPG